jgi:hypothetical protein
MATSYGVGLFSCRGSIRCDERYRLTRTNLRVGLLGRAAQPRRRPSVGNDDPLVEVREADWAQVERE